MGPLKRQARQIVPASFLLVFSLLRSLRTTINSLSLSYANSEQIKRYGVEARQMGAKYYLHHWWNFLMQNMIHTCRVSCLKTEPQNYTHWMTSFKIYITEKQNTAEPMLPRSKEGGRAELYKPDLVCETHWSQDALTLQERRVRILYNRYPSTRRETSWIKKHPLWCSLQLKSAQTVYISKGLKLSIRCW